MNRRFATVSVAFSLVAVVLAIADSRADEKGKSPGGGSVAEKLVTWALEADVAGDARTREKHLRMALEAAPESGGPNWHLGRVAKEGRWLTPTEVRAQAASDSLLAEYETQRLAAQNAKDADLTLARWCTRHGVLDRAKVHYQRAFANGVADERTLEEVAKALELKFVDGAWRSEAEIALQKQQAEFIQAAIDQWRPKLEKLYQRISSGKAKAASVAHQSMLAIDDPRAVFALETFLASSDDASGQATVELLSRFPEFEASAALVRFAVLSPSPNVRQAATTALRSRPWHHSAPLLINSLSSPIESEYAVRFNGNNSIVYEHYLLRQGADANLAIGYRHQYEAQCFLGPAVYSYGAALNFGPANLGQIASNASLAVPDPSHEEVRLAAGRAIDAYLSARNIEDALSQYNSRAEEMNAPIFTALEGMTDVELPQDPVAWREWWLKDNEVYSPPPTQFLLWQDRDLEVAPVSIHVPSINGEGAYWMSCFQAGVEVWTEKGLTPIEEVRTGDRVYSQNPQTGELALKFVIDTPVGPPRTSLLRVNVAGEDLFPTLGHDMFVTKSGWRMAKEIAVGDRLHSISGGVAVEAIENLPAPENVYNLIVEDFNTYFVGKSGLLVHDMTFRRPTTAIAPGLVAAGR